MLTYCIIPSPASDGSPNVVVNRPLVPYHRSIPAVKGVTNGAILEYIDDSSWPSSLSCTNAFPPVAAVKSMGVEYPNVKKRRRTAPSTGSELPAT